ncbi:MAG: DsbA family protein [Gemmatimonadota bacterium]
MTKQSGRKRGSSQGHGSPGGTRRPFYVALVAVAVAGIGFLIFARGDHGDSAANRPLPAWARDVKADPAAGVSVGPEDAPVTIMEFADYQCPHCAEFSAVTGRMIRQNYAEGAGLVRWVMFDYPLGSFPNSVPAALAARCAGAQGAYWPMHDMLLGRQARWGFSRSPEKKFEEFAEQLGLDRGKFKQCLKDRTYLQQVLGARGYGDQLGVQATPTVFLNGRRLSAQEMAYDPLEKLIRAAADSARARDEGHPAAGDTEGR